MKRFFAIIVLAAAVATSAFAQPKAIGGRFGYSGLEVSYEHCVGTPNFFEFELGVNTSDLFNDSFGFMATAMYNFVFAEPNWTDRGDWQWYAGPGITTGYLGDWVVYRNKDLDLKERHWDRGFMIGLAGQVGLSYTFWFPLQLAVDIRPVLGLHISNDKYVAGEVEYTTDNKIGFYNQGFTWNLCPTLAVRYAF